MTTHSVTIEYSTEEELGVPICRWRCSCGHIGDWKFGKEGARQARNHARRHVASTERDVR